MMLTSILLTLLASGISATNAVSYAALSSSQIDQVTKWAMTELWHNNQDVCWKDSKPNGAGFALTCPPNLRQDGLFCYGRCDPGWSATAGAIWCYQNCPSNFRTDGDLYCAKPAAYGRGDGRGCDWNWGKAKCNPCRDDEDKWGARCYPKCDRHFHASACCLCSPNCPAGFTDIGVSCERPKRRRTVDPVTECPPNTIRDPNGALCYPQCPVGHYAVGPVCWKSCGGSHSTDCGAACASSIDRCVMATIDMVLSPITMAANILTFGAASKVTAAKNALTTAMKLKPATVTRLAKVIRIAGGVITDGTLLADAEVQNILNGFEDAIKQVVNTRLVAAYGTGNAAVCLRDIAIKYTMLLIIESIKEIVSTIVTMLDPTGVTGVIAAFAHPKCRDPTNPPTFTGIILPSGQPQPVIPLPTLPPPLMLGESSSSSSSTGGIRNTTSLPSSTTQPPTTQTPTTRAPTTSAPTGPTPAPLSYARTSKACTLTTAIPLKCQPCSAGWTLIGMLCYENCKTGYSTSGQICVKNVVLPTFPPTPPPSTPKPTSKPTSTPSSPTTTTNHTTIKPTNKPTPPHCTGSGCISNNTTDTTDSPTDTVEPTTQPTESVPEDEGDGEDDIPFIPEFIPPQTYARDFLPCVEVVNSTCICANGTSYLEDGTENGSCYVNCQAGYLTYGGICSLPTIDVVVGIGQPVLNESTSDNTTWIDDSTIDTTEPIVVVNTDMGIEEPPMNSTGPNAPTNSTEPNSSSGSVSSSDSSSTGNGNGNTGNGNGNGQKIVNNASITMISYVSGILIAISMMLL